MKNRFALATADWKDTDRLLQTLKEHLREQFGITLQHWSRGDDNFWVTVSDRPFTVRGVNTRIKKYMGLEGELGVGIDTEYTDEG